MRKIRKEDVNWKDTAFLSKFMNETGKILNKYQSRLPTGVHRKVAKTIKKVRDMEIFAHVGLLKPTDKIPVGSFILHHIKLLSVSSIIFILKEFFVLFGPDKCTL